MNIKSIYINYFAGNFEVWFFFKSEFLKIEHKFQLKLNKFYKFN